MILSRQELEDALCLSLCGNSGGLDAHLGVTIVRQFQGTNYAGVICCKRQGDRDQAWFTVSLITLGYNKVFWSSGIRPKLSSVQVVYTDTDAEELTSEQVEEYRVVDGGIVDRTAPRIFSRDSWLVSSRLGQKKPTFCIVHRVVGDFQEEQFGCSECSMVGYVLPPCDHVVSVQNSLRQQPWDGTALMAPTPPEPDDLRNIGSFRHVYGVFVISGTSGDDGTPVPAPHFYANDLPFDPSMVKFRLLLAVLSDMHGTYQIVTGKRP